MLLVEVLDKTVRQPHTLCVRKSSGLPARELRPQPGHELAKYDLVSLLQCTTSGALGLPDRPTINLVTPEIYQRRLQATSGCLLELKTIYYSRSKSHDCLCNRTRHSSA